MQLKNGSFCPLVQGDCKQLECVWFTRMRGMNRNTGEEIDEYGCAVAWLPSLLVETAQQSREAGAAVESFRNEVSNNGASLMGMIASAAQNKLKQAP